MPDSSRFSADDPAEQRRRAAMAARGRAEVTDFDDGAGAEEEYFEEKPKRGCWGTLLIGCLWGTLALVIIGGILVFWISRNWRNWVSDFGSQAIKQTIEQTELPAQEKAEINEQVDRLAQAFKDKKLSGEQLGRIIELLVDSPLATSIVVSMVENKYFDKSGLSDEEKKEGLRELRRFARGTLDDKIPEDKRDAVIEHVAERDRNDNWKLRDQVSDDELRAMIAEAKAEADAANIEAEPEVVDPSEEFKRIVDEALGVPGAGAPAEGAPAEGAPAEEGPEAPKAEEAPAAQPAK